MYTFYTSVHARPPGAAAGPTIELAGRRVQTLAVSPDEVAATPMSVTFEQVRARLDALERLYSEPDGSFVWVSAQGEPAWQVDGNLFDRSERLQFVDLKGTCPVEQFDRLLAALGWPDTPLLFQLTREAVFLDESEFRRWAGEGGSKPRTVIRRL
jgi:hypothetical protein